MQKRKKELFVSRTLETFMFENWLRFYFIRESGNDLILDLPEKAMGKINSEYPHLASLAEELRKGPITPERSQQALCLFINSAFEQTKSDPEFVTKVMNSRKFNVELQVFHLWVDSNESQLDEQFLDFAVWKEIFSKWKETDAVQQVYQNLISSPQGGADSRTQ